MRSFQVHTCEASCRILPAAEKREKKRSQQKAVFKKVSLAATHTRPGMHTQARTHTHTVTQLDDLTHVHVHVHTHTHTHTPGFHTGFFCWGGQGGQLPPLFLRRHFVFYWWFQSQYIQLQPCMALDVLHKNM